MKIIVGLGNPGRKYEGTRHNVGFDALRKLAEKLKAEPVRAKFESMVAECQVTAPASSASNDEETSGPTTERLLLVWPQTYMNRSGLAARQASQFYKLDAEELLVICDDLHLPTGKLRLRASGSAGGQNGLNDVIQQMGSDQVPRLRMGVGPKPEGWEQASFVLGKFSGEQRDVVEEMVSRAADAALCWATAGIAKAMNQYN